MSVIGTKIAGKTPSELIIEEKVDNSTPVIPQLHSPSSEQFVAGVANVIAAVRDSGLTKLPFIPPAAGAHEIPTFDAFPASENEPLLTPNPTRHTLFPIKFQDIYAAYKIQ
jgi:hypothetical protein